MKKFVFVLGLLISSVSFSQVSLELDSSKVFEAGMHFCNCEELRNKVTFDSVSYEEIPYDTVLPDGTHTQVFKPVYIAWFTESTKTKMNGHPFGVPVRKEFLK